MKLFDEVKICRAYLPFHDWCLFFRRRKDWSSSWLPVMPPDQLAWHTR